MSLLRKASIVTTPTAYENGKILSVKPVQSLGVEQIENGNFATDSDWTKGTGWTISGGTANATSAATGTPLSQYIDTGKKYKITYDVVSLSQGAFQIDLSYSGTALGQLVTTTGTFTDIVTSINPALSIRVVGTTTGSIDNVSVKELIDADFDFTRNSSGTRVGSNGLIEDMQILSGDLVSNGDFSQIGSELVTNGDFATDSDWNKGTGWSISNSKAIYTGTSNSDLSQNGILTSGKLYKLEYKIISSTLVNGIVKLSGTTTTTQNQLSQTQGTHTLNFIANGTSPTNFNIRIVSNTSGQFEIDSVSVKEVFLDWTVQGDNITIVEGAARINRITNTTFIQQNVLTSGKTYLVEFDVLNKPDNNGTFIVRLGSNNVYDVVTYEGTRFSKYITSNGTDFRIYSSSNNGVIYVDNVSLIEITDDTNLPRIDYTGGEGHWLFEPQSTNLVTYNNDLTNSDWTTGYILKAANDTISPNGTLDASKVTVTLQLHSHYFQQQFNIGENNVTISAYVKNIDANYIQVTNAGNALAFTNFDIQNGTVGTSGSAMSNQKIEELPNDWYRISVTVDNTGFAITYMRFYMVTSASAVFNEFWLPTSAVSLNVWGVQCELGDYKTSIIPTTSAAVTRLQDAAFGAGSSDLINSTEGVLYAEVAALANDGTFRLLSLSDGTSSNRVYLGYNNNDNTITANVTSGGVSQGIISYTTTDLSLFHKVALKYKNNDVSLYVNGIEVGVDTSATTPSGLNALQFTSGSISSVFFGKTKCVAVFKEALSNDELECLTGEGYDSFNALALANNYTII